MDAPGITPKPGDEVVISIPAEKIEIAVEAPIGDVQMLDAVYQKETYAGFSSQHQLMLPNGIEFIARTPQSGGQVKRRLEITPAFIGPFRRRGCIFHRLK